MRRHRIASRHRLASRLPGEKGKNMKLIIAGGRDYQFTQSDFDLLDGLRLKHPVEEVVSGGATGADSGGEDWAKSREIPVKGFPADWKTYGKAAGPMRNQAMASYADAVALFPGGKGTASMYRIAKATGIEIYDFRNTADTRVNRQRPQPRKVVFEFDAPLDYSSEETGEHIRQAIAESPIVGQCSGDYGHCGQEITEYEIKIASASASPLLCSRCVMEETANMLGL